ncbi:MAG: hypothetical protein F6K11_03880 [Leptolyngbya sp. SIO3F4]|nr:hypothetical protein [Leptolyngbya sp. SIO3F4]
MTMKRKTLKRVCLLLSSTLLLLATPTLVLAGSTPVIETDSGTAGQGDGFAAGSLSDQALAAEASNLFVITLQAVVDQGQVDLGDTSLSLTTEEIQAFNTLLSGGSDTAAEVDFLVDQISEDVGLEIDINVVAASAANLELVVDSFNNLIASLNGEQLRAAYASAPLQAILQALRAAVQSVDDDANDESDSQQAEAASLILLELL